ncbi:TetR/AcrR family transcriptional regulator [Amaricoccus solimangrovi]|uniref:TetR/AcrR family transcriptional regulator n=1 Tax=Amaricoccus solimangrovi TaxID=2589815 RepID=A0A501WXV1_9RHOB|nr:TetR/AcrR family transcriptional regulator [Amaricoccus solimangrovi]TPE53552.1 TetR/AcrR family transcriptional regulator [Amaricoccus solimangrovi]
MKPAPLAAGSGAEGSRTDGADGAKRRQILDGARRCFLASGFEGASMGEIAREAKVSKGTLYVYFDSKEALFEALIDEKKRDTAERMLTLEDTSGPVGDVMRAFGAQLILALVRPDHVALVRLVIGASERFPEIARTLFESGPEHGAKRLEQFLRERQARGELGSRDMTTAAWQFIGMCYHRSMTEALLAGLPGPDSATAARRAGEAVETFLAAYGPGR